MKNKDNTEALVDVYIGMSVDLLHHGHLAVIGKGAEMGRVTVGLLTDKAIASYKRLPFLNYDQRQAIVSQIKGVDRVVPQETLDYEPNLRKYRPTYVVHGDDWRVGVQAKVRQNVINTLAEWDGELVETKYVEGISSTQLIRQHREVGTTPEIRQGTLRRLIAVSPVVRVLEAHNGLSALVAERSEVVSKHKKKRFDALWSSSLTSSLAKGMPDNELLDFTSRLGIVNDILESSTLPLIYDGDSGGQTENFGATVRTLERLGVSAIVIEDKQGFKRNSLLEGGGGAERADIIDFSGKIQAGKKAQVKDTFMIIARIESFILGQGLEDALHRAEAYAEAGADAVMIPSRHSEPDEILAFCQAYCASDKALPVVAVPTTYDQITEDKLAEAGVRVVIYANHMLRSTYLAMTETAERILKHGRSYECRDICLPIDETLALIPG